MGNLLSLINFESDKKNTFTTKQSLSCLPPIDENNHHLISIHVNDLTIVSFTEWSQCDRTEQISKGLLIPPKTIFELISIIDKTNCPIPNIYPLVKIIYSPNKDLVGLEMNSYALFPRCHWNILQPICELIDIEPSSLLYIINNLEDAYNKKSLM